MRYVYGLKFLCKFVFSPCLVKPKCENWKTMKNRKTSDQPILESAEQGFNKTKPEWKAPKLDVLHVEPESILGLDEMGQYTPGKS